MTVAELIEKLKALPQDAEVQYSDYEQGDSEISVVQYTNGWTSFDSYLNNRAGRTQEQYDALPMYVVLS